MSPAISQGLTKDKITELFLHSVLRRAWRRGSVIRREATCPKEGAEGSLGSPSAGIKNSWVLSSYKGGQVKLQRGDYSKYSLLE